MLEKERKKRKEERKREKKRKKKTNGKRKKDGKKERWKKGKTERWKDGREGIKHTTQLVVSKLLSLWNALHKSLELKPTASIIIVNLCKHII